ncbi:MAG: hypothetical protein U1E65_17745 [Myxococcota bacterium]
MVSQGRTWILSALLLGSWACGSQSPGGVLCLSGQRPTSQGLCIDNPDGGSDPVGGPDAGFGNDPVFLVQGVLQFGPRVIGTDTVARLIFSPPAGGAVMEVLAVEGSGADAIFLEGVHLGEEILVPPGRNVGISVRFTPTEAKEYVGSVVVNTCRGGCTVQIAFMGSGTDTAINCQDVDFGSISAEGCTQAALFCNSALSDSVTILFVDTIPADLGIQVSLRGATVLPPFVPIPIEVNVCPKRPGEFNGTLAVHDTVGGQTLAPTEVRFHASATPPPECSLALTFAPDRPVQLGSSAPMAVQLVNHGVGVCPLQVQIEGQDRRSFVAAPDNPGSVGPNETIILNFTFRPIRVGQHDAVLRVTTPSNSTSANLSGFGIAGPGEYQIVPTSNTLFAPPPDGVPLQFTDSAEGVATLSLPFDFTFPGGSPSPLVGVSVNGFLYFDGSNLSPPRTAGFPSPAPPNGVIAWWWDDLMLGPDTSVRMVVTGPVGQRVAHLVFDSMHFQFVQDNPIDVVIRFFEEGSAVEIQYSARRPQVPSFATAGWESLAGDSGNGLLGCSPECTETDYPAASTFRLEPVH